MPVFNAPFSNTRSVAELVVAEVIALARQLGDRSAEMHAGTWRKVSRGCYEVRGTTLGIVGYGHIGSQARARPRAARGLGRSAGVQDGRRKRRMGSARGPLSACVHAALGQALQAMNSAMVPAAVCHMHRMALKLPLGLWRVMGTLVSSAHPMHVPAVAQKACLMRACTRSAGMSAPVHPARLSA